MAPALEDPSDVHRDDLPTARYAATWAAPAVINFSWHQGRAGVTRVWNQKLCTRWWISNSLD